MKTKVMVDTNVFIYGYDESSVFHEKATAFLSNIEFELYTSTKNIAEYFAVQSKLRQPFDKVFKFYQEILANTTLLFPSKMSFPTFEMLVKKYQPIGNRVFDVEIASIAIANGIPEIKTVNMKDFFELTEIKVSSI